jgi:hypothetical protein
MFRSCLLPRLILLLQPSASLLPIQPPFCLNRLSLLQLSTCHLCVLLAGPPSCLSLDFSQGCLFPLQEELSLIILPKIASASWPSSLRSPSLINLITHRNHYFCVLICLPLSMDTPSTQEPNLGLQLTAFFVQNWCSLSTFLNSIY